VCAAICHGLLFCVVGHNHSVNADVIASIRTALSSVLSSSNRIIFMDNSFQDAQLVLAVAASMNMTGPKALSSAYFQWIGDRYWLADQLLVPTPLCNLSCIETFRSAIPVHRWRSVSCWSFGLSRVFVCVFPGHDWNCTNYVNVSTGVL
jgi:hypothetical protein